jgi:hypothetical protein
MEYGGVLLLFDGDNPSWTEELVGMAGEDPGLLGAMVADGLLRDEGGVFSLTDAGREAFREEAAACFLPASLREGICSGRAFACSSTGSTSSAGG